MIDLCGKIVDSYDGDGHTRGPWVTLCARLRGHSGDCRDKFQLTPADHQEDQDRKAEEGVKFRRFINQTAERHRRREYATAELERLLLSRPSEEFTITVPAVIPR